MPASAAPPKVLLDANVLLRYLTGDPVPMADRAKALLERAERGELVLILTPLTLAECIWVLKSFYTHSFVTIAGALQQVLALDGVRTQQLDVVSDALSSMARHNVDFADAYLAELSHGWISGDLRPGFLTAGRTDTSHLRTRFVSVVRG